MKVEDGEELFTFHDSNPAAPHHLLVIPKVMIRDASALTLADAPLVRRMWRKAVEQMRAAVAEAEDEDEAESGGRGGGRGERAGEGRAFDEEELLLGFHMPPGNSVAWLHLHAIYPRSQMRRRWKYTPLSFKSPEWVLRRLSSLPKYGSGVNRLALLDVFKP